MAKRTSSGIAQALFDAGIISRWQYHNTRRIVVDISYNARPVVYFESLIDDEILEVALTLQGIQVKTQKDGKFDGDNPRDGEEGEHVLEEQDPGEPAASKAGGQERAGGGSDPWRKFRRANGEPGGYDPREDFSPGSY